MADSDCAECKYNHNYGGKCPYDEYDCVFYPLNVMTAEEVEKAIAAADELKSKFENFESALGDYDTCHVGNCRYGIECILDVFNRDRLEEYKRIMTSDINDRV